MFYKIGDLERKIDSSIKKYNRAVMKRAVLCMTMTYTILLQNDPIIFQKLLKNNGPVLL
jgi:hypothetical protein